MSAINEFDNEVKSRQRERKRLVSSIAKNKGLVTKAKNAIKKRNKMKSYYDGLVIKEDRISDKAVANENQITELKSDIRKYENIVSESESKLKENEKVLEIMLSEDAKTNANNTNTNRQTKNKAPQNNQNKDLEKMLGL